VFDGNRSLGGKGSNCLGTGGNGLGGAVHGTNSAVTLVTCRFETNQAQGGATGDYGPCIQSSALGGEAFGGAVSLEGGVLTNLNCIYVGNEAFTLMPTFNYIGGQNSRGGAIHIAADTFGWISGQFTSNRVVGGDGNYHAQSGSGQGGAIFSAGQLELV